MQNAASAQCDHALGSARASRAVRRALAPDFCRDVELSKLRVSTARKPTTRASLVAPGAGALPICKRAGGGAGQFVGAGEGDEFKVLHELSAVNFADE
jgi:hypothetical protein